MKTNLLKVKILIFFLFFLWGVGQAQNDVFMQAFYWNVPYDTTHNVGTWYQNLTAKIPALKSAGFEALWSPPPSKGNWGITDAGYGIYDHYDLGEYNQKGAVSTHYGVKQDLINFIAAAHSTANSQPYMEVYADGVLNHKYGEWGLNEENNPVVKTYQMNQGIVNGNQYIGYLNDYIHWVIPSAPAGTYYIDIKGFDDMYNSSLSTYAPNVTSRGYNLNINWTNAATTDPGQWETEPNNGGGTTDPAVIVSGQTIRAHSDYQGDVDEFKFTVTSAQAGNNVVITLVSMNETGSGSTWQWVYGNQMEQCFYPSHIWYNGTDIGAASTGTHLEAHTQTKTTYPTRNAGTGEASYQWDYTSFHPVDGNDWLGDWGSNDAIVPNTMAFGNDFNTYSTTVQSRLNGWGDWLMNTIGFDGFRLDFVRGYQVGFISNWVNQLPKNHFGQNPYIVGEYWTGNKTDLQSWVNQNASSSTPATVSVFDFPLHNDLVNLCNGNSSSFNMTWLNHTGMIRDPNNPLPAANVCTFVEDHDNAKNSGQWITKDWQLAYAYILTHEGKPMVFYTHYYGIKEIDYDGGTSQTVTPPASLQTDINKLIFVRNTYLGNTNSVNSANHLTVLTELGSPTNGNTANIYVARRAGNGTKNGALIVLNNATSTQSITVNTIPSTGGWPSMAGQTLVNAFNPSQTAVVASNGTVTVQAGSRSYAIYVLSGDYVAYGTNVPVTGVTVSPATASIGIGGTQQLTATIAPANATNQAVTWSSGNTAVATVSSTGLVTGVAAGTATITVKTADGSFTATCAVTVSNVPVTGVTVSPTTASITIGGTQQLTATVSPSNATNKTVTWSSSNTAVATVSSTGLVTGVAAGTATITVTTQDQGKTATCAITVNAVVVTGVTVSPTSATLGIAGTQQLTATVSPSNATNKNVTWSSSNTAVATVSSTGLVTGVAAGTATITVTTQDQGKTATCAITVSSVTYYTIVNRWQTTDYLYDGGTGKVLYGTTPSSTSYQWAEVPVSGTSYVFLQNRATGNYMHIQDLNGSVECGAIQQTWWSAMWSLTSAGSPWDYIENRWQTSDWIHIQDLQGYAEYAGANSSWWSAMWQFQTVTKSADLNENVQSSTATDAEVSLYPNPLLPGQLLNVSISGVPADEQVSLTLYNLTGKVVLQKTVSATCQVGLDVPAGIYIVAIRDNTINVNKKLIVK